MTSTFTILDGGMSRELMRVGAPFRQPEWSALALMLAPETVTEAHRRFTAAGAAQAVRLARQDGAGAGTLVGVYANAFVRQQAAAANEGPSESSAGSRRPVRSTRHARCPARQAGRTHLQRAVGGTRGPTSSPHEAFCPCDAFFRLTPTARLKGLLGDLSSAPQPA